MTRIHSRRIGPLFGAVLVLGAMIAAVSPAIPGVAALDPTANPGATTDPGLTPDPGAVPDPVPMPSPDATSDPSLAPAPDVTIQPATDGLAVTHYWVGYQDKTGIVLDTGALDSPRTDLQPYRLYLVRFQILNASSTNRVVTPLLQYAATDAGNWIDVPSLNPQLGVPFYVANDEGDTYRTRTTAIDAASLRRPSSIDPMASPAPGAYYGGPNPGSEIALPGHSFTEVEFGVRVTGDTPYLSGWLLHLDLGLQAVAAQDASLVLGPEPPADVLPPQRAGTRQGQPMPLYRLQPSLPMGVAGAVGLNPPTYATPHVAALLTDDGCAACHSSHRSSGQMLLRGTFNPTSGLCFNCHDGTGALANTKSQYTNPSLPANNAATSSYYSHPSTTASNHLPLMFTDPEDPAAPTGLTEFAKTLNRHSGCTDCHQPHASDSTTGTQTTTGWTAGGAIKNSAGVAVVNGAANTAPSYTLVNQITYEYQLCFKCHSGYTTLPTRSASHPSWQALDKAIEFNPANLSFHPIEAKGTNANFIRTGQTVGVMDQNLAGTSSYKVWTFTSNSTIRCENCHGSTGQTQVPANAGAQSDNHASLNRGILLNTYRDRLLKPGSQAYSEAEFALCFMCHTNLPFLSTSSTLVNTSNFRYHGYHMRGIPTNGTYGTGDIDSDGAGGGNALCSECHFQIHGSSYPGNTGAAANRGLVNFAPNVQTYLGTISITLRNGNTSGRCTLMCHGKEHQALSY